MDSTDFLYSGFLKNFAYMPTRCQETLFRKTASFLNGDSCDIMVVNGYAGTGKTSAVSAVIAFLKSLKVNCILLAPTGRAAKVLSVYAGSPAFTVHKHIYRQKSVSGSGFGEFVIGPNKDRDTVYFVDEVSLIGIDASSQAGMFGSGNLLSDLVDYVRKGVDNKLVLIGDMAQLPPVGLDVSPALSREYMSVFGTSVWAELDEVVRQQDGSGILKNATILRNMIQKAWDYGTDDLSVRFDIRGCHDVERIDGSELIEKLSDAYARYGDEETVVICRSNRRAIRYNLGIRAAVQFKEEQLVRGDRLMIVRNCYSSADSLEGMDYIANGDIVTLESISRHEERYGLHFATARLSFPDYGDQEITANVILDTLVSESPALTAEQQNMLYEGVNEDYSHISSRKKRYEAVREDRYYNALQLKYANALTCHKSQGGQWRCVFIDNPFWQEEILPDDLKWLYTALTRSTEKVYLVNFKDSFFI